MKVSGVSFEDFCPCSDAPWRNDLDALRDGYIVALKQLHEFASHGSLRSKKN